MPSTLVPCRLDAGSETLSSRFEPSLRTGYVVRVLRTACYLAALPRRVLAVESQVASGLSPRDNHLCDFMSHAVIGIGDRVAVRFGNHERAVVEIEGRRARVGVGVRDRGGVTAGVENGSRGSGDRDTSDCR